MVPQPVKAVIMLFPITEATEAAKEAEEAALTASGQEVSPSLWYTKQTISNACGTIGMLHAYANCPEIVPLPDSFLARYLEAAKTMTPAERARFLEHPKEGEPDIEEAHAAAAQEGQTAPPPEDEQVQPRNACAAGPEAIECLVIDRPCGCRSSCTLCALCTMRGCCMSSTAASSMRSTTAQRRHRRC